MSMQPHGRYFMESRSTPDRTYDYHRQQNIDGKEREKRDNSDRSERNLGKSKLSGDKHVTYAGRSPDDQHRSKHTKDVIKPKQHIEDNVKRKSVAEKSYSEDYRREKAPPIKRGISETVATDAKPKKRLLVKQSTHGKFELVGTDIVIPQGKQDKESLTGDQNKSLVSKVVEQKDITRTRRTLPSTPFSIFRRKVPVEETLLDQHGSLPESMQTTCPILNVSTSDKSEKQRKDNLSVKNEQLSRKREPVAISDIRFKTDLNKRQFFARTNSDTQSVHEFIPLQNLKVKPFPSHGSLNTKAYEKKYKERIRLKDKSFSTEDSRYSGHLRTNTSAIKSDYTDGKKSVAFCSIHSSNSSYDGNDKAVVTNTESDLLKPECQQKQFLSPENVPMLEKSKSLQRLANQSSTETSGLGETITSGLSSQESILSYYSGTRTGNTELASAHQDQGIDLREDTRNIRHEGNGTFGTRIIDSGNIINHTNELKKSNRGTHCVDLIDKSGVSIAVLDTDGKQLDKCHGASGGVISGASKEVKGNMTSRAADHLTVRGYRPPLDFRSNDVKKPDNLPMFSANVGPDFDTLFTQSKNLKVPAAAVGIQLDQINNEWNKHKRSSSIKSRSSQGSFRSRSGSTRRSKRFLAQAESQWMKWGRERRQSFRRRMEQLEKPPEPEIPRASTPVKKARQEGLMFVHPDLGSKYISEDDINYIKRHKQERLKTCKLIEKSKTKLHHEAHDINRLTPDELMTLSRFWEHRVFVRTRYVSILLSLVTTVIYVLSICSTQWVTYPSPGVMDHYAHEGLWFKCHPVQRNNHYTESCEDPTGRRSTMDNHQRSIESSLWESACWKLEADMRSEACKESRPSWQNAVIGLMIFSAAFGFVAAILAICGVCTSPLPKKIYYFHSAGEIFFVCALTTTVALIIYAVAISTDESIHSHTYGSGYGLGWGGTAFFFAASFCMSLDELVRESAQNKCCRYLCWRSRSNDRDNSQNV